MRIVWNSAKAQRNVTDHEGVTFEEAATSLYDPYAVYSEDTAAEGEQRFRLLGASDRGRVLVVIYAYREEPESIRIISAWKATGQAKKLYEQKRR